MKAELKEDLLAHGAAVVGFAGLQGNMSGEISHLDKAVSIGVDRKYATVGQSHVLSAFDAAIDVLRRLGATIVDVTIPSYAEILAVGNTIAACEYSVAAAHLFREHPSDFDLAKPPAASGADIKAGALIPAVDYIRATQKRRLLQREFAKATKSVAVFISPTYPLAPRPFRSIAKSSPRICRPSKNCGVNSS